jgi:hypothetical protein
MKESMSEKIVATLFFALLGVLLAVVLIEWAAGCGEHYIDAQGITHQYQCVILPTREKPNAR